MREIEDPEALTILSIMDPKHGSLRLYFKGDFASGPCNFFLRKERLEQGLTAANLAIKAGFSPPLVSHLETLKTWPTPSGASKIAQVLQVEAGSVFPTWLRVFVRERKTGFKPPVLTESEIGPQVFERAVERSRGTIFSRVEFPDAHDWAEKQELQEALQGILGNLSFRYRFILELRFPSLGQPWTYRKIAKLLGCSHTKAELLEKRAIENLRTKANLRKLTPFRDQNLTSSV